MILAAWRFDLCLLLPEPGAKGCRVDRALLLCLFLADYFFSMLGLASLRLKLSDVEEELVGSGNNNSSHREIADATMRVSMPIAASDPGLSQCPCKLQEKVGNHQI